MFPSMFSTTATAKFFEMSQSNGHFDFRNGIIRHLENIRNGNESSASEQLLLSAATGGIFAGEDLQRDVTTKTVVTTELLSSSRQSEKFYLKKSSDEFLTVQDFNGHGHSWIRNITLSQDVHSNNAIIEITQNRCMRLRICKNVRKDDEITCWFSEEISTLMEIPFLSPINILGNNCYTCQTCRTSYETPNPLKIHLATLCGQQNQDILWYRLHYTQRPPESILSSTRSLPAAATLSRTSAFKPIVSPPKFQLFQPSSLTINPESSRTAANAAAEIETIVSNMGSSKQGHLCIYCGKIYSRKYGLKIHIRTHTGFKPLKCKFCFRPFGDPSNLNKHIRLHLQANNSIYKCHLCHKALARRRDLQRHLHTRHNFSSAQELMVRERRSSSEDEPL